MKPPHDAMMAVPGPVDWVGTAQKVISEGGRAVLIMVTEEKGSTPRDTGTWMLVSQTDVTGTLGGGELERMAEEAARAMLSGDGESRRATLHCVLGPDLRQCCGGAVTLMLEPLDTAALGWLSQAADSARADNDDAVVFRPDQPATKPQVTCAKSNVAAVTGVHLQPLCDRRLQLFLFGAGHVGRSVAAMATQLPLRLTVIDARATMRALIPVSTNVAVADLEDAEAAASAVPPGSAALVMTHSHELDYVLCRALLTHSGAIFVGLIGSRSKATRFRRRLKKDGVPDESLARLTSPIGSTGPEGKEPGVIALAALTELLSVCVQPGSIANQDSPRAQNPPHQHRWQKP